MLKGQVICRLPGTDVLWGRFEQPDEIICALNITEVNTALKRIEAAVSTGKYAAGFISYEAAPAFDPAYKVHPALDFPLLWFGIYSAPAEIITSFSVASPANISPEVQPSIDFNAYCESIRTIKTHIEAGDIYQANYTIRTILEIPEIPPEQLFFHLCHHHPAPYAAYIDSGDFQLISISPELFLDRHGQLLRSIPMKGTAPRRLTAQDDRLAAEDLRDDPKNRAENLMIVDMVRNDLGRICVPGTIAVDPLFEISTYRTVHQMTSTVHGTLPDHAPFGAILNATFPAASITGAPKIRAMEIINQTENSSRRAYTGSIGCIAPGGDFCLNVAIRTIIRQNEVLELSVGGGIVADSQPESEWLEALCKSRFAAAACPDFHVLETLLYSRDTGFHLLDGHLRRAEESQRYFGRDFDPEHIRRHLHGLAIDHDHARIRLTIDENGHPSSTVMPLENQGWDKKCLRVAIAPEHVNSKNVFLHHKTTCRAHYNEYYRQALEQGWDEMIFHNERGELTEGCISNIFLLLEDGWATPALSCGVLPGLWREKTIAELGAKEQILTLNDLAGAQTILLGNSVRGGAEAQIFQ